MHSEEQKYIDEAVQTNWVSSVGANIQAVEELSASYVGVKYAVALASGTAALHLAVRLAAQKLYGKPRSGAGSLKGHKVFCSDVTFSASVNPVVYEWGEPVLIDSEYDTWNMDPEALRKAFKMYPDVKLIVIAHLYGTPSNMDEITKIAAEHDALIVEDAAEALGSEYKLGGKWTQAGRLSPYGCISFNGNKVITGSAGGMFLTDSPEDAAQIRKWSTQSRENAAWYQHEEIGYNYRMSNIVAGILRGQFPHLDEHIAQKRAIYKRYKAGLSDLPVKMNPFDEEKCRPNCWLSCMTIEPEAMCKQVRSGNEALYITEPGKTCPTEILEALAAFNAEGRPIWKPMHLQPLYRDNSFIASNNTYRGGGINTGTDIFCRGLCLPSDNKMTAAQQDRVIDIIHRCFK